MLAGAATARGQQTTHYSPVPTSALEAGYYPFLVERPEADLKVVEADWGSMPNKLRDISPNSLTDLLPTDVSAIESILRQPAPGQDATALQRGEFFKEQGDKVDGILFPLAAQVVTAQFLVVDATETAQLSPPVDPRFGKYFVTGRMEWQTDATRPIHLIYLFSDDPAVVAWKRGDLHAVNGVIQKAGIRMYLGQPSARLGGGSSNVAQRPVSAVDEFEGGGKLLHASGAAMTENGYWQAFSDLASPNGGDIGVMIAKSEAVKRANANALLQTAETIPTDGTPEQVAATTVLMEFVIVGFTGPEPKLIVTKPTTAPATRPTPSRGAAANPPPTTKPSASRGATTKAVPATKPAGKITVTGRPWAGTEYGN
jgi:hypothetical protein